VGSSIDDPIGLVSHGDSVVEPKGLHVLNLLNDAWIPVRRKHSGSGLISPPELTGALEADPVIALDWPRADFRIASLEFLIGLLATACPPADPYVWPDYWRSPPPPEALQAAFAPIAHAFSLDGDGPRFLQDAEELVADSEPVERLLIEAPGDSTLKHNTDMLVRRGRATRLSRATAAMALYTFQSWAPAGGAGNRTGLRGGGPLTTLVLPHGAPSLWHVLWANVPRGEPAKPADLPRIFPWLAPTLTSEAGRIVTPQTAHELQCWWGMPRRIRLDFAPADPPAACDLTGERDTVMVTGWRQRPRGANYAQWGGVHPLTPTYQQKPATEVLPVHPQPGGIGYRHWLGLVLESEGGLRKPARAVSEWRSNRCADAGCGGESDSSRLLAAGFDMDNMKARAFVETEMPLPALSDGEAQERLDRLAEALVQASDLVASLLRGAVRAALFSAGASVKLDWELLSSVREQFWERTDAAFFEQLKNAAARGATEPYPECAAWLTLLRRAALDLFDEAAPLAADSGAAAPRIGKARRNLLFALLGYGKDGQALFSKLGQSAPETKRPKGKSA
jgi:CRISPR system Cascade subunit CasA